MTFATRSLLSRSAAAEPSRRRKARSVRSRPWRGLSARPWLEVLEDRTVLSTFTVTNTGDNGGVNPLPGAGTGTLRQAIVDAAAAATGTAATPDLIQFNIPTSDPGYQSSTGSFSIQPLSALPTITDTVVLDGYTQPGASPNTLVIGDNAVLEIVLDGSQAGSVDGLVITAGNCTVQGLVIDNFALGTGINLNDGSGNELVIGNFIGTDVTGESAAANNIGIVAGYRIGVPSPGDRNIISGNADFGIDGGNGMLIEGDYIGTDKSGTSALPNETGIILGSNSTIGGTPTGAGNLISGNAGFGMVIGNQIVVAGDLIGTTANGLAALGNGSRIYVEGGNNNTIGGTTAGARNIISGNANPVLDPGGGWGIDIENVGTPGSAQYNLVEGNYIGTDITGTTGLGGQDGIVSAGDNNTIGGTTAAARNIISGNAGEGIQINGGKPYDHAIYNVVQGNYIGTDATGTQVVSNGRYGIWIVNGTYDNTIGGTLPGAGNVISGNGVGIELSFVGTGIPGPTNNLIQGNLIGTDKTGTVALGGGSYAGGIQIDGGNDNTIGGTTSGAGNTIAFNGVGYALSGVDVYSGIGNSILGNCIFANGSLGIVLNSANNANDNQTFPVLTGVSTSGSGTTISGTLQSAASTTFRIEFFANTTADPSGYGQGQTYLGFTTVTTNSSGYASFTATGLTPVPAGQAYPTATATNLTTGDTSQFSLAGVPTTATLTASANPSVYGQAVTFTATVNGYYAGGAAMPSGSVDFVDTTTNTNLGSVPLSGDTATLTTAALQLGSHLLTATYSGDGFFLSTVASLTQSVTPYATTTSGSLSSNFLSFGQPLIVTAAVTANPPGSGTPTGTVDFYDTTAAQDLGSVALSSGVATLTVTSLPAGTNTLTLSYSGSSTFLASSASVTVTANVSILVLDPTANGALSLSSNAAINVPGTVVVDSSSSSALTASGSAVVKAGSIQIVGKVQKSGSASFTPAPVTGAAALADPLAHLAAPSTTGLTNYGAVTVSSSSSKTLQPGIYSQISISGSASVTLNPGIYIIEGGGFTVSGTTASVTGTGVLIYNTGSKYPMSGGSYGALTVSGSGRVQLSASATGAYAGIVIDQDPNNTQSLTLSGTALTVTGTVYAPKAQLLLSGSAQLNATIDVDLLTLSGSAMDSAAGGGGAQGGGGPGAVPVTFSPIAEAVVPPAGTVEPETGLRMLDGLFALSGKTLGTLAAFPAPQVETPTPSRVALPLRPRETEALFAARQFEFASDMVRRAGLDKGVADAEQGWLADSLLDQLAHDTVH